MTTIRTKSHNYIPPTREEMRAAAKQVELKRFSPSLVEDVCNLVSGGGFTSPSEMRDEIMGSLCSSDFTQASDGDYKYQDSWVKNSDGYYAKSLSAAKEAITSQKVQYHKNVQDFLRELSLDSLPGNTPLEQAMGLLSLLSKQKGGTPSDGDEGDTLPIFTDQNANPEGEAAKINEAIESAEEITEEEKDLMGEDGKSTLEIAKDLLTGKREILEISRQLNKLVRFKVAKTVKLEPDANGDEVRYRPMKELSEIDRMHPTEWAHPKAYRNYRMVTGQSPVRERCTRLEKKQLLYVLIDCSGSMESDNRFYKAGGVLMNRLQAVINGDAEVFFSFFDGSLKAEQSATNTEEAKAAMAQIKRNNFSGGSTAIAACCSTAIERIQQKLEANPGLTKPELVVVTDGDDNTSSLKLETLKGIRLHTFVVGGDNPHLVDLARRNGGVGIANL